MVSDPFLSAVAGLLRQALGELGVAPEANLEASIEQPPNPEMGDYAYPCFPLARQLRTGPPAIAQDLAARIAARMAGGAGGVREVTAVEAAGPYVNFRVSLAEMARQDVAAFLDGSAFALEPAGPREKVMIEWGGN